MKGTNNFKHNLDSDKEKKYIIPYRKFQNSFVPNWLLRRNDISNGAKLLYSRLCQHAGKDGNCFPRIKTLAEELGRSPRTISRYIKELVKHGLIKPVRLGKKCANRYRFPEHEWMEFIEALGSKEDPVDETDMAPCPMPNVTIQADRSDNSILRD